MRRLARHAFRSLSALSLLLAVAACVLWVRSLWVTDSHIRGGIWQPGTWNLVSGQGEIGVNVARGLSWAENAAATSWRRDYVLFATGDAGPRSPAQPQAGVFIRTRWVSTRHWVLALAFATLGTPWAVAALRRRRSRRRLASNQCHSCGYDLRACPGRCPECGAEGVSRGMRQAAV